VAADDYRRVSPLPEADGANPAGEQDLVQRELEGGGPGLRVEDDLPDQEVRLAADLQSPIEAVVEAPVGLGRPDGVEERLELGVQIRDALVTERGAEHADGGAAQDRAAPAAGIAWELVHGLRSPILSSEMMIATL
jgi:hypothetical protein